MYIALFEDKFLMTRLSFFNYSRLMGATYLDLFINMVVTPGIARQLKPALGGYVCRF
jgi:hypothetical protein